MECVHRLLVSSGFVRTNVPCSSTIVVHAVAGAGKSALSRRLLKENPHWRGHTTTSPDPVNLEGVAITAQEELREEFLYLLDEYPLAKSTEGYSLLLADPYQHAGGYSPAHYTCRVSWRVPPAISKHLRSEGYDIESHPDLQRYGSVKEQGIHTPSPPIGKVLAVGKSAHQVLHQYYLKPTLQSEVIGLEYPSVTILLSIDDLRNASPELRREYWVAATRALCNLDVRRWVLPPSTGPQ